MTSKPYLVVGAPVAERGWILPRWYECLRNQTLPPDELCFVYSPSQDETLSQLHSMDDQPVRIHETKLPFFSRDQRDGDAKDPHRASHMARLRNQLKTQFMRTEGEIFVSLDTDILLENPQVLQELVATLQDGWDVACALTHLHPLEGVYECYNAGFWWGGEPQSFTQGFQRATLNEVLSHKPPLKIDVPMACYALRRHVLGMCKYHPHELGEDMGFAQSLARYGYRTGWRTDLPVRHVWGASYLDASPVGASST